MYGRFGIGGALKDGQSRKEEGKGFLEHGYVLETVQSPSQQRAQVLEAK